ncbi:MAG TPA: CpsB/CapC family capsule biosynthesis tyrosine phosphatase, partial [Thermoanaerobaculia bacterium]|nr:CpsB/CapC family capsule biosynthesis tyrosine phosphatase [Thermoanaerobaculia bacterium]
MIEVHFHCLPGLDDGPADWDEAVALCRAAAAEGTTTLVATPHVLRDPWSNNDPAVRDRLILKLNAMLAGKPSVLAGCEYFFSSDAVELVERGKWGPLTGLNRTRYLLLEFAVGAIPPVTEAIFHELSLLGVTPVIAHPERTGFFAALPERLEELVSRGAVAQITAGSLLGDFGTGPLAACEEFFRRGLVHLIASDAHSLDRRPPRLAAARQRVRRHWGREAEVALFEANPQALL